MRLTLLNTSILTAFGDYRYEPLSFEGARILVREFDAANKSIESAIGHKSTAELLSTLLEFQVHQNRVEFKQTVDDLGLVLKLKQRPPAARFSAEKRLRKLVMSLDC